MKKYIAREVRLTDEDVIVDGVYLPWHVGRYPEVNMESAPYVYGLDITIQADRVIVDAAHLVQRDTLLEAAREEAIRIVRDGMRDVRVWLGETTEENETYEGAHSVGRRAS